MPCHYVEERKNGRREQRARFVGGSLEYIRIDETGELIKGGTDPTVPQPLVRLLVDVESLKPIGEFGLIYWSEGRWHQSKNRFTSLKDAEDACQGLRGIFKYHGVIQYNNSNPNELDEAPTESEEL